MLLGFYYAVAITVFSSAPAGGQEAAAPWEIVRQAPDSAWRAIAAEDLLIGTLESGDQVVIQLAPQFASKHVANVRALASLGWWDGTPINRVQDNFVVQWGGAAIIASTPANLSTFLPAEYEARQTREMIKIPAVRDSWSANSGFVEGWPVAARSGMVAPAHCYGTVGAGRDAPPDTGWGSELYVVIGQAPRQLDRNMAVVGRVIAGMEFLAGQPRGRGASGELSGDQVPARWRSLTRSDLLPSKERPVFEFLDTSLPFFLKYATALATYRNSFYLEPPVTVELCNVRIPIRPRKT